MPVDMAAFIAFVEAPHEGRTAAVISQYRASIAKRTATQKKLDDLTREIESTKVELTRCLGIEQGLQIATSLMMEPENTKQAEEP